MIEILVYFENDKVILQPNFYILPTHEEIDQIISAFQQLKNDFSPEDIEQYNNEALEEIKRQDEELRHSNKQSTKKTTNEPTPIEGYIYVIKSENLYKVGRTTYPCNRIDQYRTENPYDIEVILLAKIPDYFEVEKQLLEKLSEKQHHGEWFILEDNDIQIIRNFVLQHAGMLVDLPT